MSTPCGFTVRFIGGVILPALLLGVGVGLDLFYGFTILNEAWIPASGTAEVIVDRRELVPAQTNIHFALDVELPLTGGQHWQSVLYTSHTEQYWLHFHLGRERFRFPVTRETYERVGTGGRIAVDYGHRRVTGGSIPLYVWPAPSTTTPFPSLR